MPKSLKQFLSPVLVLALVCDPLSTGSWAAASATPSLPVSSQIQQAFNEQAVVGPIVNALDNWASLPKRLTFRAVANKLGRLSLRLRTSPSRQEPEPGSPEWELEKTMATLESAQAQSVWEATRQSLLAQQVIQNNHAQAWDDFRKRYDLDAQALAQEIAAAQAAYEEGLGAEARVARQTLESMEALHRRAVQQERERHGARISEWALSLAEMRQMHERLQGAADRASRAARQNLSEQRNRGLIRAQLHGERRTRERQQKSQAIQAAYQQARFVAMLAWWEALEQAQNTRGRAEEEAHALFWLQKVQQNLTQRHSLTDAERHWRGLLHHETSILTNEALLKNAAPLLVSSHSTLHIVLDLFRTYTAVRMKAAAALRQGQVDAVVASYLVMRKAARQMESHLGAWPSFNADRAPWRQELQSISQAFEFLNKVHDKGAFYSLAIIGIADTLEQPHWTTSEGALLGLIGLNGAAIDQAQWPEFRAWLRLDAYGAALRASGLSIEEQRRAWIAELLDGVKAGKFSALTAQRWWEQPPQLTAEEARDWVDGFRSAIAPAPVPDTWADRHAASLARLLPSKRWVKGVAAGIVIAAGLWALRLAPAFHWITPAEQQTGVRSAQTTGTKTQTPTPSEFPADAAEQATLPALNDSADALLSVDRLAAELQKVEMEAARVEQSVRRQERRVAEVTQKVEAARKRLQAVEQKFSAPPVHGVTRDPAADDIARGTQRLHRGLRSASSDTEGAGGTETSARTEQAETPSIDPPGARRTLIHYDKEVSGRLRDTTFERFDAPSGQWRQWKAGPAETKSVHSSRGPVVNSGRMMVHKPFEALIIPPGFAPDPESFEFGSEGVIYDLRQDDYGVFYLWIRNSAVASPVGVKFDLVEDSQERWQQVTPNAATREPMAGEDWQNDTRTALAEARQRRSDEARIATLLSHIAKTSEYTLDARVAAEQRQPPDRFVSNLDRIKITLSDPEFRGQEFRALHCAAANTLLAALARQLGYPVRYVGVYLVSQRSNDVTTRQLHAVVEIYFGGRWHMYDATPTDRDQKEAHFFSDSPIAQQGLKERMAAEQQLNASLQTQDDAERSLDKTRAAAQALRQRREQLLLRLSAAGGLLSPIPTSIDEQAPALAGRLTVVDRQFQSAARRDPVAFAAGFSRPSGPLARERRELERARVPSHVAKHYLLGVTERAKAHLPPDQARWLEPLRWTLLKELLSDPAVTQPIAFSNSKGGWVDRRPERPDSSAEDTAESALRNLRRQLQESPEDTGLFPHGGQAVLPGTPPKKPAPQEEAAKAPEVLRYDASGSFPMRLPASTVPADHQIPVLILPSREREHPISWVQDQRGHVRAFLEKNQIRDLHGEPIFFRPFEARSVEPRVTDDGQLYVLMVDRAGNPLVLNALTGEKTQMVSANDPVRELLFDAQGQGFLIHEHEGTAYAISATTGRPLATASGLGLHLIRHRGDVYAYTEMAEGPSWGMKNLSRPGKDIAFEGTPIASAIHIKAVTDPFKDEFYLVASIANRMILYNFNLQEISAGEFSRLDLPQFDSEGVIHYLGQRLGEKPQSFTVRFEAPTAQGSLASTFGMALESGVQELLSADGEVSYWVRPSRVVGGKNYKDISILNPNATRHGPYRVNLEDPHVQRGSALYVKVWNPATLRSEIRCIEINGDSLKSSPNAEDVSAPILQNGRIIYFERFGDRWSLKVHGEPLVSNVSVPYAEAGSDGAMVIELTVNGKKALYRWQNNELVALASPGVSMAFRAVGADGFYYTLENSPGRVQGLHGASFFELTHPLDNLVQLAPGPQGRVYALVWNEQRRTQIWRLGDAKPWVDLPVGKPQQITFDEAGQLFLLAYEKDELVVYRQDGSRLGGVLADTKKIIAGGFFMRPDGTPLIFYATRGHWHVAALNGQRLDVNNLAKLTMTPDGRVFAIAAQSDFGLLGRLVELPGGQIRSPKGVENINQAEISRDGRVFFSRQFGENGLMELLPDGRLKRWTPGLAVTATNSTTVLHWTTGQNDDDQNAQLMQLPAHGAPVHLTGGFDLSNASPDVSLSDAYQTGPAGTSLLYVAVDEGQFSLMIDPGQEIDHWLQEIFQTQIDHPDEAKKREFQSARQALLDLMDRSRGPFIPVDQRLTLALLSEKSPAHDRYVQALADLANVVGGKEMARKHLADIIQKTYERFRKTYGTLPFNPSGMKDVGWLSQQLNADLLLFSARRFPLRIHEHPSERELVAFNQQVERLMNRIPWLRLSPADLKTIWQSPRDQAIRLGWESLQQTLLWLLLLELLSAAIGSWAEARQINVRRAFSGVLGHWTGDMTREVFGYQDVARNFSLSQEVAGLSRSDRAPLKPYLHLLRDQPPEVQAAAFAILRANGIVPRERLLGRRLLDGLLLVPAWIRLVQALRLEQAWKRLAHEQRHQPVVGDRTSLGHFMNVLQETKDRAQERLPRRTLRIAA